MRCRRLPINGRTQSEVGEQSRKRTTTLCKNRCKGTRAHRTAQNYNQSQRIGKTSSDTGERGPNLTTRLRARNESYGASAWEKNNKQKGGKEKDKGGTDQTADKRGRMHRGEIL